MTAGLAAVGFFLEDALSRNVWIVYVDNEVYDPEVRRPRAGSERLIRLPNPHRVLGDLKESRAKALYGAGNYARAAEVFHELHKETADQRFLPYASLCRMYAAWYAFNFTDAHAHGQTLLEQLEQPGLYKHPLQAHRATLHRQVAGLEGLKALQEACVDTRTNPEEKEASPACLKALAAHGPWLLATLWHLTGFHRGRGNLVLAALTAYRALELCAQYRLARHGISASRPQLSEEAFQAFWQARCAVHEKSEADAPRPPVPPRLTFLDAYVLLWSLEDEVITSLFRSPKRLQHLKGIPEARNRSLLVHGFGAADRIEGLHRQLERVLEALGLPSPDYPAQPVPLA